MSIVDKINEENRKKFGEIQKCCGMFKEYCRCDSGEIILPNSKLTFKKEYWFGPTDGPAPKIEVIPPDDDHSLDEVTKWFRRKLLEASEISSKPVPNIKATTLGLELPTLDMKTGKLKWSIWQSGFWKRLKFWKWKK